MDKEFVPYEQALALKELGFDENCLFYYTKDFKINHSMMTDTVCVCNFNKQNKISAPLYQQAFRWFREKYQIDSWIYPNLNGLYSVSKVRRGVGLGKVSEYQTYEEAELECLKKLIEIVKQNNNE